MAEYRIENHAARDADAHVWLGHAPLGTPVGVDRRFLEADLRITTALIEPHFMAGYSGGRKIRSGVGVCQLPFLVAVNSLIFVYGLPSTDISSLKV